MQVSGRIGFLPQDLGFSETVTVFSYLMNFVESYESYKIEIVCEELGLQDIDLQSLLGRLSG